MADEIRMAIECRADEDRLGPGRIVGTLMVYGKRARDRAEVFEPGSLEVGRAADSESHAHQSISYHARDSDCGWQRSQNRRENS